MRIGRLAVAACLLVLLPVQADALRDDSAALAAAREAQFHRLWPSAAPASTAPTLEIRDLLAADRPWDAAVLAARLEADAGAADAAALLASAAARSGLLDSAPAALRRAAAADRRLLANAASDVADRLLAEGRAEAAIKALTALPPRLDRETRNRAALIKARAQFALDRPRDAAQTLQAAEYDPLLLIGAAADERLAAGVLQYDLALALIRSGAVDRGRALLDRLGRDAQAAQALRDRANLSLATDFLDAGQGATARAIYERVALEGPYSNPALLGMGWAAIGPQGAAQASGLNLDAAGTRSTPKFVLKAMQRRRLIDCENYNRRALAPTELCRRQQPFEQAVVPSRTETLAEEAIAVWQALSLRDPRDPAVREAWSALGAAAARAGQRTEAIEHYETAAGRLEAALADNAAATERLTDDTVAAAITAIPALAPGQALPAQPLAAFEVALGLDAAPGIESRQGLLAQIGETRWLIAAVDGDVPDSLAALPSAQHAALTALATSALAAEAGQLRRWLTSVRMALATLADPSFVLRPSPIP